MKVVVVGSGAREHALAHVLSKTADVVCTPGNPGMAGRSPEGHEITSTSAPATALDADLYVIGPEEPLVDGIADQLRAQGSLVFGPGADGARLEGSKAFMKDLVAKAGVPTARYASFDRFDAAAAYLRELPGPYVIKTDGLAAGKGVLVAPDLESSAEHDIRSKLSGSAFGDAGRRVVVEECLVGPEISLLVLTDGRRCIALPAAQDFKRIGDGDTGLNTGGMGVYSPVPVATPAVIDEVMDTIIEPTLAELRRRFIAYRGVLYAGLMLTSEGPKLIEYNIRFGDPESEVVLPRVVGDVAELLASVARGELGGALEVTGDAAVCVVLASSGYPSDPRSGDVISGVARAGTVEGVTVFHVGTRRRDDGALVTAGGRVLVASALGPTIATARERAYEAARLIEFDGAQYRFDIAFSPDVCLGCGFGDPVISRYALPEMAALFSDEARFRLWLEVEVLASEAWARLGVVPTEHALAIRERQPLVDADFVARVEERERVTDHDVAAFVDVVQEAIGAPEGSWVHYGLTSTDVVDTAEAATLVRAADLILSAADELVAALKRRALEHASTPILGRTHGMHAEPTTFGNKLALFCLQVDRDRQRIRRAREGIAVGKLSGAVGTYSNIDPEVERQVCAALGLRPVPATQVLSRDRHAEYLYALATTGATIETIATELRHLQRSEVGEAEEPFAAGQKGSSAMPHKRNPITSERLVGMARVLRGYLIAGLEDVALWHERDISHSSVERIVMPDASHLCYYALKRMTRLIDGLVVHADRMEENLLVSSLGLVFSQPVLLALIEAGLTRDAAYRIVQSAARRVSEERQAFRAVLESDGELTGALGQDKVALALDEAFDLDRALRNAYRTIEALDEIDRTES